MEVGFPGIFMGMSWWWLEPWRQGDSQVESSQDDATAGSPIEKGNLHILISIFMG